MCHEIYQNSNPWVRTVSKKGVNNTANAKESTAGQTWRRLKRIEIVFFIAC